MAVFHRSGKNCSTCFITNLVLIYYFAQPFGIKEGLIIVHRFEEKQKI